MALWVTSVHVSLDLFISSHTGLSVDSGILFLGTQGDSIRGAPGFNISRTESEPHGVVVLWAFNAFPNRVGRSGSEYPYGRSSCCAQRSCLLWRAEIKNRRRNRWVRQGKCPDCGYDLKGSAVVRAPCPERGGAGPRKPPDYSNRPRILNPKRIHLRHLSHGLAADPAEETAGSSAQRATDRDVFRRSTTLSITIASGSSLFAVHA